MNQKRATEVHNRWFKKLRAETTLPTDAEPGSTIHKNYENGRQCLSCRYYLGIEGRLGADWGVCSNPRSERDGKVTFEHSTCVDFKAKREGDI